MQFVCSCIRGRCFCGRARLLRPSCVRVTCPADAIRGEERRGAGPAPLVSSAPSAPLGGHASRSSARPCSAAAARCISPRPPTGRGRRAGQGRSDGVTQESEGHRQQTPEEGAITGHQAASRGVSRTVGLSNSMASPGVLCLRQSQEHCVSR